MRHTIALLTATLLCIAVARCSGDSEGTGRHNGEFSAELEARIKQDYVNSPIRDMGATTVDKVGIHKLYGDYNGTIVLAVSSYSFIFMTVSGDPETVAGKTFVYPNPGFQILVWNKGKFYLLSQSFEKRVLTAETINTIYNLHSNLFPEAHGIYESR